MPRSREATELLDQFMHLEGAGQVLNWTQGKKGEFRQAAKERNHPLKAILAGRVFELFAYNFQSDALGKNSVLVTPKVTLDFYSALTGRPKLPTLDGYSKMIAHLTVPDGMEFYTSTETMWTLSRIHEYKLSQDLPSMVRQMNHLIDPRFLRRNLQLNHLQGQQRAGKILSNLLQLPNMPPLTAIPDVGLHYSVPENSTLKGVVLPKGVSVDYLPIHTAVLGEVIKIIAQGNLTKNEEALDNSRVLG